MKQKKAVNQSAKDGERYRNLSLAYANGEELIPTRVWGCPRPKVGKAMRRMHQNIVLAQPRKTILARQMRQNMTPAEKHLWEKLKNLNCAGPMFIPQAVVSGYIADFCCFERNLIIEIDGPIHNDRKEQDAERDRHLKGQNYRVLRFSNDEVLCNRTNVIGRIVEAL